MIDNDFVYHPILYSKEPGELFEDRVIIQSWKWTIKYTLQREIYNNPLIPPYFCWIQENLQLGNDWLTIDGVR